MELMEADGAHRTREGPVLESVSGQQGWGRGKCGFSWSQVNDLCCRDHGTDNGSDPCGLCDHRTRELTSQGNPCFWVQARFSTSV